MASRDEELSADRLCAASAAVMRAVKEITDSRTKSQKSRPFVAPYPPDLMGSTDQKHMLQLPLSCGELRLPCSAPDEGPRRFV